ncbi:MAG: PEP-utilizing enzyme [Ilumatobacter sp.]|jgi:rifampicin phosphotransferase|uniref:PEP-utilizing enzyme n=1 Tax=Ilumatobacter sp. TaxID=1967498 RepID=UPI003919F723
MSSSDLRARWRRPRPEPSAPLAPTGALRLGSGTLAGLGVSDKAALLDRALAAGLAVPDGLLVPDGISWNPLDGAAFPAGRRVAVRSAFGAEDRRDESLAGWFTTLLDVESSNISHAIDEVRASALRRDGDFRRDVLLLEMVDADHAGVAFSEPGRYDDLVNVTDGLADRLVGGEVEGERLLLARLEQADDGWPRRLQALLGDVRDEFGDRPWDIEWADDGDRCWLIQIRPITAAPLRDETLTAANHAEILPRLPSQLMTSVIAEAGPDLFDWYRRRVPGLPADRDFLHVVAGRPMINLSLLEDMMRHLGLPTKLVAESIGGGHGVDQPGAPMRIVRRSPALVRLGLAQVSAVAFASRNRRRVAAIGARPAADFTAAVDDLHRAYVALVTGMFPLSSAIGPPLAVLRSSGTLYEHAARHRTITAELARRRAELRTTPEPDRGPLLAEFLRDFGHRGVYESDIARPRYADDPEALADEPTSSLPPSNARTATSLEAAENGPPRRTVRGRLTSPVWWIAKRPLDARERFRHDAMRSFQSVRRSLVRLADTAVGRGQLREVDDLWLLDADETRRLDRGWMPEPSFWHEREQLRHVLDDIDVPHVVQLLDDPASWSIESHASSESDTPDGPLRGLPLSTGRVEGIAWVLDEPSSTLPPGFAPDTTILVARSIDAGWISTLGHVAAVVVEIGGDLSHGSILLRELGIPSITNVTGATRRVSTGDALRVDARSGSVLQTTKR